MGLQVQSRRDAVGEPMYRLTERLYLDGNGEVVGEKDPTRASLLGLPGDEIPLSQAERLGLVGGESGGYADMTVRELRELLEERELDTKGKKAELIERLQAADDASPAGSEGDPDDKEGPDRDDGSEGDEDSLKSRRPSKNKMGHPTQEK